MPRNGTGLSAEGKTGSGGGKDGVVEGEKSQYFSGVEPGEQGGVNN